MQPITEGDSGNSMRSATATNLTGPILALSDPFYETPPGELQISVGF